MGACRTECDSAKRIVMLRCVVLCCVALCCVVWCGVVLCCIVLYCVVLCCAVLCCTVLYCVELCHIVLFCAVLYYIRCCQLVMQPGSWHLTFFGGVEKIRAKLQSYSHQNFVRQFIESGESRQAVHERTYVRECLSVHERACVAYICVDVLRAHACL